ncbi:hypothetical protein ALC152_07770 [Arcobacter sp. 15-2]|uniref:hypothetical protein n=1 Tax=Arcobacter sp. 15-2 TaxID=3374109 RepID=UPI00399CA358
MENKKENKPMPKWLVYTLFILKFMLSIALIFWTVYMTLQSDVGKDDDNAFLSNQHDVDDNYNKIMEQNNEFNSKYNVKFVFNDEEIIGLSHSDIYLSQRVIKERKIRKNMLHIGKNSVKVYIQDKNANEIKESKVDILVTKNTTHAEDVTLNLTNERSKEFEIQSFGYWNITGTVEVNGSKGSFYIKTNASRQTK